MQQQQEKKDSGSHGDDGKNKKTDDNDDAAIWAAGFFGVLVGIPAITLSYDYYKHARDQEVGVGTKWF